MKQLLNIFLKSIRENKLAWIFVLFASIFYLLFVLISYNHFRFTVLDLGLYNRHMWGLTHFDLKENPLKGFNLIGDHAHFILFLLSPIYYFFQDPKTLLVVQVLAITLSGYPIYLIAKKYFCNKIISALWLVPYFLFFGFFSALDYPFHVAPIAVLPLAWSLFFLLHKNYCGLLVSLIFLLLVKEDMPLIIMFFGLYLVFVNKKPLLGSIITLFSLVYFIFVTNYWLIQFNPNGYYYSDTGELGGNWLTAIKNSLIDPPLFWRSFFQPAIKVETIVYTLMSFGGLSLLTPEILVFISPIWLGRFLSTQSWRWTTVEHYSAIQGPILISAAIIAVWRLAVWVKKKIKPSNTHQILLFAVILISIFINILVPNTRYYKKPQLLLWDKSFYSATPAINSAREAINLIPDDAGVGVQSAFPQLTSRREVYNMPQSFNSIKPEYILLSTEFDYWPFESKEEIKKFYSGLLSDYNYEEVYNQNGVMLAKKYPN